MKIAGARAAFASRKALPVHARLQAALTVEAASELRGVRHMRGTHNVDGIADPVIDALVEDVIAANSRTDLLTASKTLDRVIRSGRYWVPHWYKVGRAELLSH